MTNRTMFDAQFGVMRIGSRAMVQTSNVCSDTQAFMFQGMPVYPSELACKTITRTKKWKRLNRPNKRIFKTIKIPFAYRLENKIIMHPKLVERIKNEI